MTGEITLRGDVLPVGGIKEKVLAAHRAKIRTIVLPALNKRDLEDINEDIRKEMRFIFAETVQDVFKAALAETKPAKAKAGRRTAFRNVGSAQSALQAIRRA